MQPTLAPRPPFSFVKKAIEITSYAGLPNKLCMKKITLNCYLYLDLTFVLIIISFFINYANVNENPSICALYTK